MSKTTAARAATTVLSSAAVFLAAACGAGGGGAGGVSNNAGSYGDCQVTGKFGQFKLTPTTADVLTIKVPVPAGEAYKGNSVDTVKGGYDYCMAAQIAHLGGIKRISLQNVSYDALISGTVTGFDIAPYDLYATPERQKVVDFSTPYFTSTTGVMVRKGETLTQAGIKSAKIGVLVGSVQLDFVQNTLKPAAPPHIYQSETDAYTALRSKQIDVVLLDAVSTMPQTGRSGGQFQTIAQYPAGGGYCILLPKHSANTNVVDEILAEMNKDGSLETVFRTWLYPALGGSPKDLPMWSAS